MIIARIRGGLGNQMFQYAVARALGQRTGSPFRLHVPKLRLNQDRPFELGCFVLEAQIASLADFRAFTGGPLAIPLLRKRRHPQAIVERGHNFDPAVLAAKPPVYLDGYFQSEKYFDGIAGELRTAFRFASPASGRNAELLAELAAYEAVSVHVRRGDYTTNPVALAHHGALGAAYYAAALSAVGERVPGARLYAFSDDVAWAKQHLPVLGAATFVDHNTVGWEDLRLMAACKHQVIANSSFSWWGAWLNANPSKVVIAPRQWLTKSAEAFEDVYPPGWIRI